MLSNTLFDWNGDTYYLDSTGKMFVGEREVNGQTMVFDSNGALIANAEVPVDDGDILVVYYSATGNTEKAANYIAAATGADLFELEPVDPYTSNDLDWTDDGSRVVYEHDNPDARAVELVESTVSDWESYDTVFIGYPIWWGIAAWPVDNFVKGNDFSGKTVIPFATSASSGMGESGTLLEEMAGTGDWKEGRRFSSGASEKMVRDWVAELNLNQ